MPLQQVWTLAQSWYADRLSPTWMPRSADAAATLLEKAGLTGEFWRIR